MAPTVRNGQARSCGIRLHIHENLQRRYSKCREGDIRAATRPRQLSGLLERVRVLHDRLEVSLPLKTFSTNSQPVYPRKQRLQPRSNPQQNELEARRQHHRRKRHQIHSYAYAKPTATTRSSFRHMQSHRQFLPPVLVSDRHRSRITSHR